MPRTCNLSVPQKRILFRTQIIVRFVQQNKKKLFDGAQFSNNIAIDQWKMENGRFVLFLFFSLMLLSPSPVFFPIAPPGLSLLTCAGEASGPLAPSSDDVPPLPPVALACEGCVAHAALPRLSLRAQAWCAAHPRPSSLAPPPSLPTSHRGCLGRSHAPAPPHALCTPTAGRAHEHARTGHHARAHRWPPAGAGILVLVKFVGRRRV